MTSKYSSPAIPISTGVKMTRPSRMTKTPSMGSAFSRAPFPLEPRAPTSSSSSRRVTEMIGTLSWLLRVSITTSAVADRSGRSSTSGGTSVTITSKSMVGVWPDPALCEGGRMALLPIWVT